MIEECEIFEAGLPFGYVDDPYLGPSPKNALCPVCGKVVEFGNLTAMCLWVCFVGEEGVVDLFIHDGCREKYAKDRESFLGKSH